MNKNLKNRNNLSEDINWDLSETIRDETIDQKVPASGNVSPKKRIKPSRFAKTTPHKTRTDIRMAIRQKAVKNLTGKEMLVNPQQLSYYPYPQMPYPMVQARSIQNTSSIPITSPLSATVADQIYYPSGLLGSPIGVDYNINSISPNIAPQYMFQPRLTPQQQQMLYQQQQQHQQQLFLDSMGAFPTSPLKSPDLDEDLSQSSQMIRSQSEPIKRSSKPIMSKLDMELLKPPALPSVRIGNTSPMSKTQNVAMMATMPKTPTTELLASTNWSKTVPDTPSKLFGPSF